MKLRLRLALPGLVLGLMVVCGSARADSAGDANASNNPLNPALSLGLQNYYGAELYGTNAHTNDFLLRPTIPIAPGSVVGVPQIVRMTVPLSTRPAPGSGYTTNVGDVSVFDVFLLPKAVGGTELGVGPLLVMPTAAKDELGTGKWQAGLAAIAIYPTPSRLLGALVQWQQSFAGDRDRKDVSTATFQPFGIFNLPGGWYVRSTATWSFDLKHGDYAIPLGLGAGKTWRVGSTIFNTFIEPQWTVAHSGDGMPKFQIFGGLNMTFKN